MARLTIDDLKRMRERAAPTLTVRTGTARARVTIHMGTCGIAAGAREVCTALLAEIEQQGITDVIVTTSDCAGQCSHEPMATVESLDEAPIKYVDLTPEKITRIFKEHVLGGTPVQEYALSVGSESRG